MPKHAQTYLAWRLLPSMEEAQAVDLADAENEQASEVEADVAQEAKETAEAGSHITDTRLSTGPWFESV